MYHNLSKKILKLISENLSWYNFFKYRFFCREPSVLYYSNFQKFTIFWPKMIKIKICLHLSTSESTLSWSNLFIEKDQFWSHVLMKWGLKSQVDLKCNRETRLRLTNPLKMLNFRKNNYQPIEILFCLIKILLRISIDFLTRMY